MKKNICCVLVALLFSFSFMNSVFAEEFDLDVSATVGNNVVVKGDEVSIKLNLKADADISTCKFALEVDSGLEFKSKNGLNNWNITLDGPESFIIENSSLGSGMFADGVDVLEFKYKVNNNASFKIKTEQCATIDNKKSASVEDVVVNFAVSEPADDATLKTLTVTNGQITPTFESNIYDNYIVSLTSPNFSLSMTASNPDYQNKIVVTDSEGNRLDPANLVFDSKEQRIMNIYITVNNSDKSYLLGVTYENKELDNSLSYLSINGATIDLEPGKGKYEFKIKNDVTEFTLDAKIKDTTNFQFAEGSTPLGKVSVNGDVTFVVLIVEPINAQSGGVSATYNIEVIREGAALPPSSSSEPPKSSSTHSGNATTNPSTGGVSMFVMAIILMASLGGSIYLYQKNLEGYK